MNLVVMGIESQLLPNVKQEIERIAEMGCLEGVGKLKPVLLETEDVQLLLVETAIELITMTSKAALVEMMPDGRHRLDELHAFETVIDYLVQILIDGKEADGVQGWKHIVEYDTFLLVLGGETVKEQRLNEWLFKLLDGYQHRWGIDKHLSLLDMRVGNYQVGTFESLAEIGRHGDAALHDVGLKAQQASGVGNIECREGERVSPYPYINLLTFHFHTLATHIAKSPAATKARMIFVCLSLICITGDKGTNNFANYKIIRKFVAEMIQDELKYRILQTFGFTPTPEQHHALDVFATFMMDRDDHVVMILRGSAGTGKTTLAGAIVKAMTVLKQKMILLAPTGRAAKVFSLNAGHAAYTIHRRIYRQKSAGDLSSFNLNDNLNRDTLFIIDEASMIANQGYGESAFGSGCLLDDLMQFVYNGQNCRMLLVGDKAQLPPVGEDESPALLADVLRCYGMRVYECDLNQVLRQSEASGILWNATVIRQMITHEEMTQLPRIRFQGFADIQEVPGGELIEALADSYNKVGLDDTMVITRSNKRANIYNQGIRNMVLDREDELCRGDQLMIVKNNYYWVEKFTDDSLRFTDDYSKGSERLASKSSVNCKPLTVNKISFLANGDIAVVQRVRNVHELYGFRFAEVTMLFPDYDDYELTAIVILDTLTSEAPALTHDQQEQLYNAVLEDYADISNKADRIKKLKSDRYYNALQIKFAYAVTCHKAQGGQWSHVYLDQGYMTDDMLTPDYIHWLYTAFTRATEKLFLVNWPKTQTDFITRQ